MGNPDAVYKPSKPVPKPAPKPAPKPTVAQGGPAPQYGGVYVGGIPNAGSFTTTRNDKWPEYKAVAQSAMNAGYKITPGNSSEIVNYVNKGSKPKPQQSVASQRRAPVSSGSSGGGGSRSRGRSRGRGGGGGGGRRGGGGGGGGGAGAATKAAQAEINAMAQLLGSGAYQFNADDPRWKVDTSPYDTQRTNVASATAQDQAAATGAYNSLDSYLQANQRNPYADVQLQRAQRAPDMNPYLASQGVAGTAVPASNPEDTGYGAFQNVLALLGANQQSSNQSRLAESQMGRTYSGQQIGAMDNAFLANIGNQQTAAQQALTNQRLQAQQAMETEKRQAALQIMQLLATPGTTAPNLGSMGIYSPGGNALDPLGWAAAAKAMGQA